MSADVFFGVWRWEVEEGRRGSGGSGAPDADPLRRTKRGRQQQKRHRVHADVSPNPSVGPSVRRTAAAVPP